MAFSGPIRCLISLSFIFIYFISSTLAQSSASTSTPVPPLQWLNITAFLRGPAPPPLTEASIGYNEGARTLLIFGGESQGGLAQSSTYLLNLDTLTWSTPSPPLNLIATPSPRSAAVGGGDFAASNRNGHVIIGGKGSNGQALSDVWEFDYINQFWHEVSISPGQPAPRWGASGGIDVYTAPVQDALVPGPNNTFYLAGGQSSGSVALPLSDAWQLNISGTLSSNLPGSVQGSWIRHPISQLPPMFQQAGTVIGQQVIISGGCSVSPDSNASCAGQSSYVLDTKMNITISPGPCPAPRVGANLSPNFNTFSSSFTSQVFLLLGTFDTDLWQDNGGLQMGEVAILDFNTGSWSRVLPSGDPGTSGHPSFPSPRRGASVLSSSVGLLGSSRQTVSDTIVFGGQDASGNYFSEVWILRAYNGSVTASNPHWSGFGDGVLQTGINANGAGVSAQFISTCATAKTSQTPVPSPGAPASVQHAFDTSLSHKTLSPLSVALLLLAALLYRLLPQTRQTLPSKSDNVLVNTSAAIVIAAYAVGIAGLVLSFTSIESTTSGVRSTPGSNFQTVHGKVGLALFVVVYGLLPVLLMITAWSNRARLGEQEAYRSRSNEKVPLRNGASVSRVQSPPPTSTPPPTKSRLWRLSKQWTKRSRNEPEGSEDNASVSTAPPQQGFEVLNRPARSRPSLSPLTPVDPLHHARPPRSLGDIDWLDRRRALSDVDELDFAITQAHKAQAAARAAAGVDASRRALSQPKLPKPLSLALRVVFHALLLALCILTLTKLWHRAPKAAFAVFLLWVVTAYVLTFTLAWLGRPQVSLLTYALARCSRSSPIEHPRASADTSTSADHLSFSDARSPYLHTLLHRAVPSTNPHDESIPSPRSVETRDAAEEEDENVTQRRIEDEMGRREVSIVTIPRRKLWVANPS